MSTRISSKEPALSMADVNMEEETKDEGTSGLDCCPFCNKAISQEDQQRQIVEMFLSTECYHQFHIPCFKAYAKKRLTSVKPDLKPGQEIEFEDVRCLRCHKVIAIDETKGFMSREELGQIDAQQMEVRITLDDRMVRCDCSCVIMFEPSKPDYKQKDESGKVISRAAADHMA